MTDQFFVNEIFASIQGEGVRVGTPNIFVRFARCNLKCAIDDEFSGFSCDTEFTSGVTYSLSELMTEILRIDESNCRAVILTGGEPSLQVNQKLIDALKAEGFYIAIETNGTRTLPSGIDWVCVSPKSAEHTIKITKANEVKYVRHSGQGIPNTKIDAEHYLISPAFDDHQLSRENLRHAIDLVKQHPQWRLSLQLHNFMEIR